VLPTGRLCGPAPGGVSSRRPKSKLRLHAIDEGGCPDRSIAPQKGKTFGWPGYVAVVDDGLVFDPDVSAGSKFADSQADSGTDNRVLPGHRPVGATASDRALASDGRSDTFPHPG
jgi:hypothetical protein